MGDKQHDGVDTKLFHLVRFILIPLHRLSPEFFAWIQCIVGEICHLSLVVSSGITVFFQLLFCYFVAWHLDSTKAVVFDNGYQLSWFERPKSSEIFYLHLKFLTFFQWCYLQVQRLYLGNRSCKFSSAFPWFLYLHIYSQLHETASDFSSTMDQTTHHPSIVLYAYGLSCWLGMTSNGWRASTQFALINKSILML